jgi:opacity protein-like surface antigen
MTRSPFVRLSSVAALVLLVALPPSVADSKAQEYNGPLTMQGVHQRNTLSAGSIGSGGTTMMLRNDAAGMFANPAMLTTLEGLQISVGGLFRTVERSQEQHYAPVRYYPNLSLLLEGLADDLPDPGGDDYFGFTPADSVQRTFDGLGPNWTDSRNRSAPIQFFIAMPFEVGGTIVSAGIGVSEYGDFGHYYQNNNVLTPNIFSQRPAPLPRPTDNNPLVADWYRTMQHREGSVMGYGGALAVVWPRINASFGVSGTLISGSTDDVEERVARGRLTFLSNEFRATEVDFSETWSTTSDFSGFETTISAILRGEFVSAGFTVRPPFTLTRSYSGSVLTGGAVNGATTVQGEDQLTMPWRGSAGLTIVPHSFMTFGLEYELRPYANAEYVNSGGVESSPWMSSGVVRVGAEFGILPWLKVRGGMRREAETFGADGRAIDDEPVWFTAYAAGAGVEYAGVRLNVGYETRGTRYQDVMGSAVYHNRDLRHAVVADLAYTINWNR